MEKVISSVRSETRHVPQWLQDEGKITQQCQNLISSLPTEPGWLESHLHQHQGFWYPTKVLQSLLWCQADFKPQDSDILLVTTPKAGTTWIKALAFALVNRPRFPDPTNHPLLQNNPHALVPFLELKLYVQTPHPDLSAFPSPRLFATHFPLVSLTHSVEHLACKIVYLCRNPKDTFVSLWHYTNSLRTEEMGQNNMEQVFEMFCRGVSPFGPYWDHVLSYWKASLENPEKILFMKFEDIKQQPEEEIRKLAGFLGCPFSAEEEKVDIVDQILKLCSFDNLSKQEVNKSGALPTGEPNKAYFRRGEVGDWKNYLTPEMIQKLNQITEDKFSGSGLAFN